MFTSKDFIPGRPTHKRVPFVRINGRMVRDTRGKAVNVSCAKLGSSMERFKTGYPIGFHKWF